MATNSLPVIDLSPLFNGSKEGINEIARALLDAYTTTGFCYLINHGVPEDIQDNLFKASAQFSELPLEKKMALEINEFHRGYVPINTSTLVTSHVAKVTKPNQSESIIIAHEYDSETGKDNPLAGPNQYPDIPGFQRAVIEYKKHLYDLIQSKIIPCLSVSLGMEPTYFDQYFQNPTTVLRLFCYPPHPEECDKDLFGSAPHSDYGFITLVLQDEIGGLQVQTPSNEWIDVTPRKGAFVMNIGDTLHKWSNGKLIATPHRVINKSSNKKRYSIVLFFDPHFHTEITALPSCKVPNMPCKFAPFKYGDYLINRINRNHQQRNKLLDMCDELK